MSTNGLPTTEEWAPEACTLPTAERPLRVAEFDALFASALLGTERAAANSLRLILRAGVEADARDLTVRETKCCSFFSFSFVSLGDGRLAMDVSVPTAKVSVLDALATRAQEASTR